MTARTARLDLPAAGVWFIHRSSRRQRPRRKRVMLQSLIGCSSAPDSGRTRVWQDRRMPSLVAQAIERLRSAGVQLDPGLSDREISRVQDEYHFVFGPEHREFLRLALPVGGHWPDWRHGSADDLGFRVGWPIEGVVFDVGNGF